MSKITDTVLALAQPVVEAEGCEIWDVEYVKEAGAWYVTRVEPASLTTAISLPA